MLEIDPKVICHKLAITLKVWLLSWKKKEAGYENIEGGNAGNGKAIES